MTDPDEAVETCKRLRLFVEQASLICQANGMEAYQVRATLLDIETWLSLLSERCRADKTRRKSL